MDVSLFDFALPPEAIAQRPAPRGTARLMTLDRHTGAFAHRRVGDLPDLVREGDLFVVNDTKVIPARLFGTDEKGRRTEFLLVERRKTRALGGESSEGLEGREAGERGEDGEDGEGRDRGESGEGGEDAEVWSCLAKPGRRVKAGRTFFFEGGWTATPVQEPGPEPAGAPFPSSPSKQSADTASSPLGLYALAFRHASSEANRSLLVDLPSLGSAPLPPYIHRPGGVADERDRIDYQTVFAREPGAIAAPTAGLHFTPELLERIEARGAEIARVTLHVGLGTFKPVKVSRIEEHVMDVEHGTIPERTAQRIAHARGQGRRVIAVGTTSVRTLEASARAHGGSVAAGPFSTNLFLVPGATFHVVDALLTNFHLPRSTLLMLVAAFVGRQNVLAAYREAVAAGYRFFSYGDAMFIA